MYKEAGLHFEEDPPFCLVDGTEAHAARGRDGRQESRECGYYHLHRHLNDLTLFHNVQWSMVNGQWSIIHYPLGFAALLCKELSIIPSRRRRNS